jgi:hypothetical protein
LTWPIIYEKTEKKAIELILVRRAETKITIKVGKVKS